MTSSPVFTQPVQLDTETRPIRHPFEVHQTSPEKENPARNFAFMGLAWLTTLLLTLGLFVLINSL